MIFMFFISLASVLGNPYMSTEYGGHFILLEDIWVYVAK